MATRNQRRRKAALRKVELQQAVADAFALEVKRQAEKPVYVTKAWAPGDAAKRIITGVISRGKVLPRPIPESKRSLTKCSVTGKMVELSKRPSGLKTPR